MKLSEFRKTDMARRLRKLRIVFFAIGWSMWLWDLLFNDLAIRKLSIAFFVFGVVILLATNKDGLSNWEFLGVLGLLSVVIGLVFQLPIAFLVIVGILIAFLLKSSKHLWNKAGESTFRFFKTYRNISQDEYRSSMSAKDEGRDNE
jgi:hypothetical protein